MRSLAITLFILLATVRVSAQPPKNFGNEARLLKKTLLENHVEPRKIDDGYSSWVFDHVIDELDHERIYFTDAEIKSLSSFKTKIDDELNGLAWNFLPELTQLYKKSLERYQAGINEIAQQPIDLLKDENFDDDTLWCIDPATLKKKLKLVFWYNTLERLADLRARHPDNPEKEFISQYEKSSRLQVQKVMLRDAERILHHTTGFESYVASEFFKTMAAAFDPHTTYFSAQEVQTFMSSLSTKGYYFGITLGENERGEVHIAQLMPGGPAWKSGEVNTGDVLQTLHWEGQDPIDLWGVDLDEINDMLTESNHSSLELTLRKSDGTSKTIVLHKEKVESEEAIVKSCILEGPRKIGYISLPDFYTDWGDKDGSQCANDVAREVIKLKKENIEGLILDLRYNGGGSLIEAVAMAGIFIDAGPVGVMKNRVGETTTVKDMNRGTVYDGPLAILVNGLSASASEFLAAALQDYNRAIIIGGSTYGKATAQHLVPTDPKAMGQQARASLGTTSSPYSFASVTFEKLYRITGKTAQWTGVIPDISLPDALEALDIREEHLPRAFVPDSIPKRTYYTPLTALPIKDLRDKSKTRVGNEPKFAALKKYSEEIASMDDISEPIPLKWEKFKKVYAEGLTLINGVRKSSDIDNAVFKASKLKSEEQRMQMDSYVDEFNKSWLKNLQEDISLNEGFLIICDLIPYVTRK